MRRLASLALILAGCGSGIPFRAIEAQLEEKGKATVSIRVSMTGAELTATIEGPGKLKAERDAPKPATPTVPVQP